MQGVSVSVNSLIVCVEGEGEGEGRWRQVGSSASSVCETVLRGARGWQGRAWMDGCMHACGWCMWLMPETSA